MNNTINKQDTLQKLLKGVDTLANIVKTTSGSQGHTYLIKKKDGTPYFTKDGIYIAETVYCEDPIENLACELLRQAGRLTAEQAGDSTTSCITIAQALLHALLEAEVTNHRLLLKEIERVAFDIEKQLYKSSKKIKSKKDCIKVATISVNGNKELGELIGTVVWEARDNGVIQLEESDDNLTTIFQEKGSRYERPYEYKQLLGSNETKIAYNNPLVVVLDVDVDAPLILNEYVRESVELNRPLVILATDFSKNVISVMIENFQKTGLKILPLVIPGYGDEKQEYYKDILSIASNDNVARIVADKFSFTLYTKEFTPLMQKRSEYIESQIGQEISLYFKDILEKRLSIIHQKVFSIHVGATSEVEMRELKDRVEDGILATRAALEEGYVLGGGLALYNIAQSLPEAGMGNNIMEYAISSPALQILKNANAEDKASSLEGNFGYNTTTEQIEDFYKSGIIDSTKAIAASLRNAVSVIKTIISCNGAIIEGNQKQSPTFKDGVGWVNE